MNLPTFPAVRRLSLGGIFALLCNMPGTAQAPKRTTGPAQTTAANRYMTAITRFHKAVGSGDAKTIIDLSYFHQAALRNRFQGQPQAVWPQLRDEYYRSVSTQMTSQPDALAAFREAAASMDGDPTRDIRVIRRFLPSSATLTFLEQRLVDFDTLDGRFMGTYVFVGVTYNDLAASPMSNVNFIKYIILRFVLSRDTALIHSVTTVPTSQTLHAKPYPSTALGYVQTMFLTKYLSADDRPTRLSIEQEALSVGEAFTISLYRSIAQINPSLLRNLQFDPRAEAVQVLNRLHYTGLNVLLVPLIIPEGGQYSAATLPAVHAVLPASGSRSDEPTATLRQKLMKGLALQTTTGGRSDYLDALSRLDGQPWGPLQLYVPQPPGPNQKNLYVRVFKGLMSDDVAKYIDVSSPDTIDFATIRRSFVKCADPDGIRYYMEGCKAEFVLEDKALIENGRIQCTVALKDTSHANGMLPKNTVLYTVEMTLIPQGPTNNEWKVVSFKAVPTDGKRAGPMEALPPVHSQDAPRTGATSITTPVRAGSSLDNSGLYSINVNGKWGFVDKSGKSVINPQFDRAEEFSEGLAAVSVGGKWGFVDKFGKYVVSTQFDRVGPLSEGVAWVSLGRKYGYVDKVGKYVINPQFLFAFDFSEGLAKVVIESGKSGYVDKSGKSVINPQFYGAGPFSEGLAAVQVAGGRWGYIDKAGKYVIEPQFGVAEQFSEGLAAAGGNKVGFVDKTGKYVINPQFDRAGQFSEGLAAVNVGVKWGFVDKTGRYVINAQFDRVGSFSEGLASVCVGGGEWGGKCGFVDKTGNYVINPQFDSVGKFSEGLAMAFGGGRRGLIDKTGRDVWNPR